MGAGSSHSSSSGGPLSTMSDGQGSIPASSPESFLTGDVAALDDPASVSSVPFSSEHAYKAPASLTNMTNVPGTMDSVSLNSGTMSADHGQIQLSMLESVTSRSVGSEVGDLQSVDAAAVAASLELLDPALTLVGTTVGQSARL